MTQAQAQAQRSDEIWTIDAYNPNVDEWQRLPVSRPTKKAALLLASRITLEYIIQTRVVQA